MSSSGTSSYFFSLIFPRADEEPTMSEYLWSLAGYEIKAAEITLEERFLAWLMLLDPTTLTKSSLVASGDQVVSFLRESVGIDLDDVLRQTGALFSEMAMLDFDALISHMNITRIIVIAFLMLILIRTTLVGGRERRIEHENVQRDAARLLLAKAVRCNNIEKVKEISLNWKGKGLLNPTVAVVEGSKTPTLLAESCVRGFPQMVSALLDLGADINAVSNGKSALMYTLESSERTLETLAILLKHEPRPDMNIKNSIGQTVLMKAAKREKTAALRLLLDLGKDIDINVQDKAGWTALMLASGRGEVENVRALVAFPGIDLEVKECHGRSALTLATENAHEDVAALLIGIEGAALSDGDAKGMTPLMHSVKKSKNITRRLLESQSSTWSTSLDKGSPMVGADGDGAGAPLLSPALSAATPFNTAEEETTPAKLPAVDVNEINGLTKMTSLMYACQAGNVDTVCMLIEHGALVNSQDVMGNTALMYAVQKGTLDIVKILLDNGADASLSNGINRTAKDLAKGTTSMNQGHANDAAIVDLLDAVERERESKERYSSLTPLQWKGNR